MTTFAGEHDPSLLHAAAQLLTAEQAEEEQLVTATGSLQFQRCDNCGYTRFPVAANCPECLGTSFRWVADSGHGAVWSYCVYHRAFDTAFRPAAPYNVALIELDSGPRMISNVLGIARPELAVGLRVVGSGVEVSPGRHLVYFRPATGEEGQ